MTSAALDHFTWQTASEPLVSLNMWNLLRLTRGLRVPLPAELVGPVAALPVQWTSEPRGCWRPDVAERCIEIAPRATLSRDELREAISHALAHSIVALRGEGAGHDRAWQKWARKLGGVGVAPAKYPRLVASCSRCGVDVRGLRAMNAFQLSQPHRDCGGELLPA
jgi:hypothetical protein